MKKLLILGGSENQLPLIKTAVEQGHHVILCDYSEDNIGKKYANTFYCVSTLDENAILEVAQKEKVDGILTNSEPAMLTASYVANKLGLPSNPYKSIITLSRKDLFRKFLGSNGFNSPKAYDTNDYNNAFDKVSEFELPVMVKPIDSSGSRGVSRVSSYGELEEAFDKALNFSKGKRVMIEEYIERTHDYMIGGDIFVFNGDVIFWGLMNSMRDNSVSEFVPIGTSFPSFISEEQFDIIKRNIKRILHLLDISFGSFNLEMMFDKNNRLFIIEMNPRSGGNKIPQILNYATGVNLLKVNIEAALGAQIINLSSDSKEKYISTYVLHSDREGVLTRIFYEKEIERNLIDVTLNKQYGDKVEQFNNADKLIGIALLEFNSIEEMKYKLEIIKELIKIDVQ